MPLKKVTEVEAVEVGKKYLVPCSFGSWRFTKPRWWVVMGPWHEDKEFIRFEEEHYHLDPRFAPAFTLKACPVRGPGGAEVFSRPLHNEEDNVFAVDPSPIVWKARRCRREMPERVNARKVHPLLSFQFEGEKLGPHLQCPHRGFSLIGLKPQADGCLQCPLHGLRFKDGVCIG